MPAWGHIQDFNRKLKENRENRPSKRRAGKGGASLPAIELSIKKELLSDEEQRALEERVKKRKRKSVLLDILLFALAALIVLLPIILWWGRIVSW